MPRDSSRQRRHFGKSIPEFGETHSSVIGCEKRQVSASIMSRSCFASFPVCVYKFSSHYLNNIIFYRQQFGASSDRLILYNTRVKPTRCTIVSFILFWNDTLHVSDGLSVHNQEFKTVHTATGICQQILLLAAVAVSVTVRTVANSWW